MKASYERVARGIELIDRSSNRMVVSLRFLDHRGGRLFLQKECRLHIRRSIELLALLIRINLERRYREARAR